MKSANRYDQFIENLVEEFSKIKNFHLTQEDGNGKVIFNFVTKHLAEIQSFKSLFVHFYLPAANKAVADDLKEISKSKYRFHLQLTREELRENYNETIRLGYIGMFHKYEHYLSDLIKHAELLIADISDTSVPLVKFIEDQFGYKVTSWKNSPAISRINWICICNKHYGGYPKKHPRPAIYSHLIENQKMIFNKDQFVGDIDLLIQHYSLSLRTLFLLAMYKMSIEGTDSEILKDDLEYNRKRSENLEEMRNNVCKYLELVKAI